MQGMMTGARRVPSHGPVRGSTSQLRLHGVWPAEHGSRHPVQPTEHPGNPAGQASRGPGEDGDSPQGGTWAPRASRGLGSLAAHDERLLQRAPSATPTLLRQQKQVTFSKFIQLEAPLGLHYSQVAWACPCGEYPTTFFSLPHWGAPRAASSPGRSVSSQWHVSFSHVSKLAGSHAWFIYSHPLLDYHSPWPPASPIGPSLVPEWGLPMLARHLCSGLSLQQWQIWAVELWLVARPRTSPHQTLSAFIFLRSDQWQTSSRSGNLCPTLR